MQTQYYTVAEAARILKTKPSTVRTYCREGKIPAVRVGRGYRIGCGDLEKWLEKQKKGSTFLRLEDERLREAEDRYRYLFVNAGDAIALFDKTGRLTLANPKFYELYGYTPDEAEGMHFARLVYTDDLPLATERFMLKMAGEDASGGYEVRAVKKGGDVFAVEVNSSSFMRESEAGGIQVVMRDVSERRRVENALKESEARYRAVVEDQSDLICRWLPDGKLTFVNEAYCRFFGKKREELIGFSFMPMVPEEDQRVIEEYVSKLTPDEPVVTYEHRVIDAKGAIRWVQWTDRLIAERRLQSVEYQSVGRDVTEQKEAREKLDESREMYKMLVKASPDSIIMTDLEAKLTYVSDQTLELHGLKTAKEILGRDAFDFAHPDERERAKAALKETLKKGIVRNRVFALLRQDGTVFQGEMSAGLIRDAEQKPKALIATVRDITERKSTEREREMLNRAVETSSDGIAIVDADQKFTYVNNAFARSHGYDPKELIGKAWSSLVSDECAKKMAVEIKKALLSTGKWKGPCEARRRDGERVWIGMSLTALENRGGRPAGFVCVLRDYVK